jgi:hypothetical protein
VLRSKFEVRAQEYCVRASVARSAFIVTEAFPFQPRCGDWSFGSKKGSSRLRLNDTPWSRQDSSGLSSTAILSSNCRLRGRGKSKEFGPLAIEITRELHDLA